MFNGIKKKKFQIFWCIRERSERPVDWVPAENISYGRVNKFHQEYSEVLKDEEEGSEQIVDILKHSESMEGNSHL